MLSWLAHRVVKDAWLVILTWGLVAVALAAAALSGLGGPSLLSRLEAPSSSLPGTQSAVGQEVLDSLAGDAVAVTLLVSDVDLSSTQRQEAIASALAPAHADLAQLAGASNVLDPFVVPGMLSSPAARSLASKDLDSFIIVVTVNPNGTNVADPQDHGYTRELNALVDRVASRLERVPGELGEAGPKATGIVSHQRLIDRAISAQAGRDLLTAEMIVLPLALLAMILILRSLIAALAPLLTALASIAVSLGALLGLSLVMGIEPLAVAIAVLMATALPLAHGLILTLRYRAELGRADGELSLEDSRERRRRTGRRDLLVTTCMTTAMRTAGRTVMLSTLAVGIGLAGLALLEGGVLQAIALACTITILVSAAVTLTLVPALLVLPGRRLAGPSPLARLPLPGRRGRGAGARRHPWAVVVGCLLLLMALALPLRQLHVVTPSAEHLPSGSAQYDHWRVLQEDYPAAAGQDATLILAGTGTRVTDFINKQVAAVPGVEAILSPSTAGDYTVVYLDLRGEPSSASAEAAVAGIRALPAPVDNWVTGQAASQLDAREAIMAGLPRALGAVAVFTVMLLLLLTGSLLMPLRALLVSLLSLASSFGLLAWLIQHGHASALVGLRPGGGLEAAVVAAAACLGLGLSLSNEVIVLTRIGEYRESGFDHATSTERGLRPANRTIALIAVPMVVVFAGLEAGGLPALKELGLALTIVLVLDALVVRALLVPAVMGLLGSWNWWSPGWLESLRGPAPTRPAQE
ncbi:MMPL family transporter [Actinomyces bowdenii]|uniref:MMPL family transporter n=1 Tax=Actinomyces bowdenii TaxID=131109 RepID=UPI001ABBF8AC|nr:MMPL family transporter [Actinomyces bowdenii]MBO3724949.1 MMPL family transporter [Actinomyces bowdenii]